MSACPKLEIEYDAVPAVGGDPSGKERVPARRSAWGQMLIHLVAVLGFLGLCAILCLVGLLWFSLAVEPG